MSLTTWRGCELIGSQVPRVWSAPSAATSAGPEALFLAETAGMEPMPWQRFVCEHGLREHADGSWAALALLLILPRQNGKGSVIEIIELYALFELGQNVYHTAHLFATCRKAFKRLWALIKRTPSLLRRVAGRPHSTADQVTITLTNGASISFVARSARMGRGFDDVDLLVLDEALFLDPAMIQAAVSGMTTRPKPMVIYASSAGVVGSAQLRTLRQRMLDGDPQLAGFEWSVDEDLVAKLIKRGEFDPLAVEHLAQANPSLAAQKPPGLVTVDWCRGELAELGLAGYLRERMGVFDADPAEAKQVIPRSAWQARGGLVSERPDGLVAFGVAAAWPDAEWASIAVSGAVDEETSVQIVERRPGTSWVVQRAVELDLAHDNVGFVVDEGGPAGNLVGDLEDAGLTVLKPTMRDVAHAAKDFLAGLGAMEGDEPYLRHYDQPDLDVAARTVARRTLGDAWTWQRRGEVDISPLEAATLATWGYRKYGGAEPWAMWG